MSPESPRNTWPVASRNSQGFGISRATREAGVADAFFAADQVVGHERTIGPRQQVRVQGVDLAERRAHLADLREQSAGQRRKRDEPFLELDALLAKRQEEIGAGVRIDDRLERHLGLGHLQRRRRVDVVLSGGAEEVADHGHVGVEDLRRRGARRVDGQRAAWPARPGRARRHLRGRRRGGLARWSRLSGAQRREPRFERGEPGLEILSQLVDLLPDVLRRGRARARGLPGKRRDPCDRHNEKKRKRPLNETSA